MDTKFKILNYIKKKKTIEGYEICKLLKISRQALNKHIKELMKEGKVIKTGTTRGVKYYPESYRSIPAQKYSKEYKLYKLEEDNVFKEISLSLNLKKQLSENIFGIINYAFTEILNNAIEHSYSKGCSVEVIIRPNNCGFKIRDYGIGLFESIRSKFNLPDESDALKELIKGKKTTVPKRHSGEGIFFTSKSGDVISFRSHNIKLIFDNLKKDIFIEEKKFIKGTEMEFNIDRYSRREVEKIFNFYAPEEFGYKFEKTKVLVKLFQERYISRSEAKRLLFGLDKFKEIILDFKGVKSIGQGFCDEIFRVYQQDHPSISIKIENIGPPLESVIKHAVDNKV